jgi:hypothetical protein
MTSLRQLTINDTEKFVNLVKSRPQTYMGFSDDQFQESIVKSIPGWVADPMNFSVGVFKEDELIGAMVAVESPHSPSWTWAYWVAKAGAVGVGFNELSAEREESLTALREADKFLFDEMENKRGLTRFFVAYYDKPGSNNLRSARSSDRFLTFMQKFKLSAVRYHIVTDAIIPAGTEPKYNYQRAIIGDRVWPIDLSIKMCVLIN